MNPTFKRYLLYLVGGLFALCAVCALVLALIPATPETAATAATDIATPLPDPDPTTPPPDPTATPDLATPEEVAYVDYVVSQTGKIGEQFREFRRLAGLIGEDSQLLMDNAWRLEMAVVTGEIQALCDEMKAYDAPPRLEEVHTDISRGVGKFGDAMDLVQISLDSFQTEPMQQAATLIIEGSEILNTTIADLEALP